MTHEIGDIVEVDLRKSNEEYYTAFHPTYSKGIEILKCKIVGNDGLGYKVESVETGEIQVVNSECINSRCRNCKNEKLYNDSMEDYFCPFCET